MATLISGAQIARAWRTVAAVGLVITGVAAGDIIWGGKNPAGITTSKCDASGNCSMSGSVLVGSGSSKTRITNGDVLFQGTASGNTLHIEKILSASGGIISETTVSGATLKGFGLGSCSNATTSKVLYNSTTNTFSCGTDQNTGGPGGSPEVGTASFTGAVLTIGDYRFVNIGGDTMTGALNIIVTGGNNRTVGLEVFGTASGSRIHAQDLLTASGSFSLDGDITFDWNQSSYLRTLRVANTTADNIDGTSLYLFAGSGSGSAVGGTMQLSAGNATDGEGGHLLLNGGDTDEGEGGQVWLVSGATGSGTGAPFRIDSGDSEAGDGGFLSTEGGYGKGAGYTGGVLEIKGGQGRTGAGGGDVFLEGGQGNAVRGGHVLIAGGQGDGSVRDGVVKIQAELGGTRNSILDMSHVLSERTFTFPNASGTAALLNTTQIFRAAQTINVTGGNHSTIGLGIINTASGAHIHAEKALTSSGTFVWEGQGSGKSLYVGDTFEGVNLTDCDADNQTLSWDATTKRFGCGDDDNSAGTPEVGTASFTGAVRTIGDYRYVDVAGDTMTGALTITVTGGNNRTLGLEVFGTMSGSRVHAQDLLTVSGALNIQGTAASAEYVSTMQINNAGAEFMSFLQADGQQSVSIDTTSSDAGRIILYGSAGTSQIQLSTQGNDTYFNTGDDVGFGTNLPDVPGVGVEVVGILSGSVLLANHTLASSGALVWEGTGSGNSLLIQKSLSASGSLAIEVNAAIQGVLTLSNALALTSGGTNKALTAVNGGLVWTDADSMEISAAGTAGQVLKSNGAAAPSFSTLRASGSIVWFLGTGSVATDASAAPDAPFDMDLRGVVMNAKEAPTGASYIVDINDGGTTVFSTRPEIDASGTTEDGNHAFSDTAIAKGAKITIDVDQVGSTFPGERVTVQLLYSYNLLAP